MRTWANLAAVTILVSSTAAAMAAEPNTLTCEFKGEVRRFDVSYAGASACAIGYENPGAPGKLTVWTADESAGLCARKLRAISAGLGQRGWTCSDQRSAGMGGPSGKAIKTASSSNERLAIKAFGQSEGDNLLLSMR